MVDAGLNFIICNVEVCRTQLCKADIIGGFKQFAIIFYLPIFGCNYGNIIDVEFGWHHEIVIASILFVRNREDEGRIADGEAVVTLAWEELSDADGFVGMDFEIASRFEGREGFAGIEGDASTDFFGRGDFVNRLDVGEVIGENDGRIVFFGGDEPEVTGFACGVGACGEVGFSPGLRREELFLNVVAAAGGFRLCRDVG